MAATHSSFVESFGAHLARGELRYARCADCARVLSFAERVCPMHPLGSIQWLPASGRATLHSFAIYRIRYSSDHPPPYGVAVVELEEGPRLVSTLIGPNHLNPTLGCALTAAFEPSGRLVFSTEAKD